MRATLPLLAFVLAAGALPAGAADVDLTVYRSNDAQLFAADMRAPTSSGMALVHEQRRYEGVKAGTMTLPVDDLPLQLDADSLQLTFPERPDIQLGPSRLLLPEAHNPLATRRGTRVRVLGTDGAELAAGTLVDAGGSVVVRTGADELVIIRNPAAVVLADGHYAAGPRLEQMIESRRSGAATLALDYATRGVGWQALHQALLTEAPTCRLQLATTATVANRSGRDWDVGTLQLIAGQPNLGGGPQPKVLYASAALPAERAAAPQEEAMDDYRSYRIEAAGTLPDGSITRLPLRAPLTLECTRERVFEYTDAWFPARPQLSQSFNAGGSAAVRSELELRAPENLPAGPLRVSTLHENRRELIGTTRVPDVPRGEPVRVTLGNAFDLRGERTQTAFRLDREARNLIESFRVRLSNGGDTARTVIVREHPNRWREWALEDASPQPRRQDREALEFSVEVPPRGHADVTWTLRYHWQPGDE